MSRSAPKAALRVLSTTRWAIAPTSPFRAMRRIAPASPQLNHLIGLLVAHHVTMRLDHLYARRSPNRVSFDSVGEPKFNGSSKPRLVKLSLECPLLKLRSDGRAIPPDSSADNEVVSGADSQTERADARSNRPPARRPGRSVWLPEWQWTSHPNPSAHGHRLEKRPSSGAGNGSRSIVMNQYFRTMEQFLETQQAVVESFLAPEAGIAQ